MNQNMYFRIKSVDLGDMRALQRGFRITHLYPAFLKEASRCARGEKKQGIRQFEVQIQP